MGRVGLKMAADMAFRVNVGLRLDLSGQIGQRNPDRHSPPPRRGGVSDRCRCRCRWNGWQGIGPRHGASGPRHCLPPGIGQGRAHTMPRPWPGRAACIPWPGLYSGCHGQHRGPIQKFLRRGGVDIFIGPPHKFGSPGRPCPSRTKFLGNPKTKPCAGL